MHRMVRRNLFSFFSHLVAMVSPEVMGRNESIFCAHLCHYLKGGMGSVAHHPLLESINMAPHSTERLK